MLAENALRGTLPETAGGGNTVRPGRDGKVCVSLP